MRFIIALQFDIFIMSIELIIYILIVYDRYTIYVWIILVHLCNIKKLQFLKHVIFTFHIETFFG